MIARSHLLAALGLWLLTVAVTAALYSALPDPAPIHWNIRGEVDGWGPRWVLALLTPALMIGMIGLMLALPWLGPLRANFESFKVTYGRTVVLLAGLFAGLHVVILLAAIGYLRDIGAALCLVLGVFVALMGNWFGKLRRNLYVGIRTPWTILNDEVWERTHRLGGRLWVVIGVILVGFGLTAPGWLCFIALMSGLLGSTLFLVIYSAWLHRRIGDRDQPTWNPGGDAGPQ